MKNIVVIPLICLAAAGGYVSGRLTAPADAKVQAAKTLEHTGSAESSTLGVGAPAVAERVAQATNTAEPAGSKETTWQSPDEVSAEWVQAARAIDRRFGIVYRICSLHPGEHKLVRQLLTRESLLQAKEEELRRQGLSAEAIKSVVSEESARIAVLQEQLNQQAPEVAQFIEEFKARPVAAAATADIADRIVIETGALTPNQIETIFSAASISELENPIPEFVNSLSLQEQDPQAIAAAAQSLHERNKTFIPAVCQVLEPAQISAFMSYMEEQLLAVRTGSQKP